MKGTLKKARMKGTVNSFYELMSACNCSCTCVYCSCSSTNIADYNISYIGGTRVFNLDKPNA